MQSSANDSLNQEAGRLIEFGVGIGGRMQ